MTNFAAVKARYPLAEVVSRYVNGRRHVGGQSFWPCPFHEEKTPSFTLTPDGGAFICFGCGAKGDLFDFLKHVEGLDLKEAVAFLGGDALSSTPIRKPTRPRHNDDPAQRTKAALAIWHEACPAQGSPVEKYLRSRGITIPIPPTIRHHPSLFHNPSGLRFDALVAAVQGPDRRVVAIHRTFLRENQVDAHQANVSSPKMALGPIAGGAVRLAPADDKVILVEGIEDGLALSQMTGVPSWAVLGVAGFTNIKLPDTIKRVLVAPDGDEGGQKARDSAVKHLVDHEVRVIQPPHGDWCDMLERYEERAAIREHSGDEDQRRAEAEAWREVFDG